MVSKIVMGTVIILDLDKFEEKTIREGWNQYTPNIITGELSRLVEEFVRKWCARVVYGLDWKRGTEEAVIEVPGVKPDEVVADLEKIRQEIRELGATISIGVAYGPIIFDKPRSRREAYKSYTRRLALKALRKIKRKGGDGLMVIE